MSAASEELDVLLDGLKSMITDVENNFTDRENDFRSMCFYNIHNRAILTREIVTLLEKSSKPNAQAEEESQDAERMMIVTRGLFTDTMSSIEKAAKDCIPAYWMNDIKDIALKDSGYLYLRYIIYASAEKGLVSADELKDWDKVFLMRNLVIHNNSVSDRSCIFEMGPLKISMRPNRMMKGPPTTFIILSEKATELFYKWLRNVDGAYKR